MNIVERQINAILKERELTADDAASAVLEAQRIVSTPSETKTVNLVPPVMSSERWRRYLVRGMTTGICIAGGMVLGFFVAVQIPNVPYSNLSILTGAGAGYELSTYLMKNIR